MERIDDALSLFELAVNPEAFPVALGTVRYWTTEALGGLPGLLVLFRIDETERKVYLLWIEEHDGS